MTDVYKLTLFVDVRANSKADAESAAAEIQQLVIAHHSVDDVDYTVNASGDSTGEFDGTLDMNDARATKPWLFKE